MENKEITIPMKEYQELLIIKGKYEELKSQQRPPLIMRDSTLKDSKTPEPPYRITL